jgi:pilus assembly protein CpaE
MVMGCFLERSREAMKRPEAPAGAVPQAAAQAEERGRAFTMFSPSGGAGTTFLAANCAMKLRDFTKEKVLLMDADYQFGSLSMTLGVQPTKYLSDLLGKQGIVFQPHHALDYVVRTPLGVDLLPAPRRPEEAGYFTSEVVRTILSGLLKEYPYVIIDTRSVMEEPNLSMMDASQEIFMITVPEVIALSRMVAWLGLVERLGYSEKKIRIIINKYREDGPITAKEIAERLNRKLLGIVHVDHDNIGRSLNSGQLLVEANPLCTVSVEISNLVRESIFTTEEEKVTKKKGSFWNWFG